MTYSFYPHNPTRGNRAPSHLNLQASKSSDRFVGIASHNIELNLGFINETSGIQTFAIVLIPSSSLGDFETPSGKSLERGSVSSLS